MTGLQFDIYTGLQAQESGMPLAWLHHLVGRSLALVQTQRSIAYIHSDMILRLCLHAIGRQEDSCTTPG